MRILASVSIGFSAFLIGALFAIFGTLSLAAAMNGSPLEGTEVVLFKSIYSAIIFCSIVIATGLSWWCARLREQLAFLAIFVTLTLLVLTIGIYIPYSSGVNDCAVGIGFPFPVDPCD